MPRMVKVPYCRTASLGFYVWSVAKTLAEEMQLHMAEPFPDSVEKGLDFGEVDAVLIGADIYGWASRAGALSALDRSRLAKAADELERSIAEIHSTPRPTTSGSSVSPGWRLPSERKRTDK